jgi:hypothetical protein
MRELKREGKGQGEYEKGGVSFDLSLFLSFGLHADGKRGVVV